MSNYVKKKADCRNLVDYIKNLWDLGGITYAELARVADRNVKSMRRYYISGEMPYDVYFRLCKHLNVPINEEDIMDNTKEKIVVTEADHPEKEWYKEAAEQTFETLPAFIKKLMNGYIHDYGTVVHAISACAIGAAWAADRLGGGITGFQASFVMWDFIMQWSHHGEKVGLRLIDFDQMLYPQNERYFEKIIEKSTFEALQKAAQEKLDEMTDENGEIIGHPNVIKHLKSITHGIIPFGYFVRERGV